MKKRIAEKIVKQENKAGLIDNFKHPTRFEHAAVTLEKIIHRYDKKHGA